MIKKKYFGFVLASLWILFQETSFPMLPQHMKQGLFQKPQPSEKNGSQSQPLKADNPKLHLNVNNWGNRCYLDSALQLLKYSSKFCQWLEENKDQSFYAQRFYNLFQDLPKNLTKEESNWLARISRMDVNKAKIASENSKKEYDNFLKQKVVTFANNAKKDIDNLLNNQNSLTLISDLQKIAKTLNENLTNHQKELSLTYNIYQQQDAHEFLIHILDTLRNDVPLNENEQSVPQDCPWIIKQIDVTPADKNGIGIDSGDKKQFHKFLCQEDLRSILNLSILGKNFQDAWDHFVRNSPIVAAPEILFVSQELFKFSPKTGKTLKSKGFPFPRELDFFDQAELGQNIEYNDDGSTKSQKAIYARKNHYQLKGIVLHSGDSANSGHYITRVQHPDFGWIELNDVSFQQKAEVLNKNLNPNENIQADPYIALYEKTSVEELTQPLVIPLEIPQNPKAQAKPKHPSVPQQTVALSPMSSPGMKKLIQIYSDQILDQPPQNTEQNQTDQDNQQDGFSYKKALYAIPSVAVIAAALIRYRQAQLKD